MAFSSRMGTASRIRKRMMAPEQGASGIDAAPMKRFKTAASSLHSALFGGKSVALHRAAATSVTTEVEPSCKRRLSFAETPRVIEIPRAAVTQADRVALRAAAATVLDAASGNESSHAVAWRELASHISDRALAVTFRTSSARRALIDVLGGKSPSPPGVLDIAASVLALAAETFGPTLEEGAAKMPSETGYDAAEDEDERALCSAAMRSLARGDAAADGVLESMTAAIVASAWVRLFPDVVLAHRGAVLRHAFGLLNAPNMDVNRWKSVMSLICLVACVSAPEEKYDGNKTTGAASLVDDLLGAGTAAGKGRATERDAGDGRKKAVELGVREEDVREMLRSADRFGRENSDATTTALQSLSALCCRSVEVASLLVAEDGAAVVRELALAHRNKCTLQIAAVELLATLSAPRVLYSVRVDRL
jgi:hypothetical protein